MEVAARQLQETRILLAEAEEENRASSLFRDTAHVWSLLNRTFDWWGIEN
jgi:hypothetical protein